MKTFTVDETRSQLSSILERVSKGEEVIVSRDGEPIAKLVPYSSAKREPGRLKGKIRFGPDFDAPLAEETLRTFRGEFDPAT